MAIFDRETTLEAADSDSRLQLNDYHLSTHQVLRHYCTKLNLHIFIATDT
jgi:hypothetical protein